MQKLILINGRFMSQPVTGVQRFAREVISEIVKLEKDKFKFIIALPEFTPQRPIPGIETYNDNSSLTTSLWQQIRLPILMRKLKADLLWSPCNIGPVFAKNHIVLIHDTSSFAGPEWFSPNFRRYYRLTLSLLGRRAVKVLTPSIFSKSEIIRYGLASDEKITVIPGGVSPGFSPHESRRNLKPYVLTVGSRNPRKNVSRLIEAWKDVPSDIKRNRRLLIAGRGARSFSPEDLKGIPDDVRFTGYLDDTGLTYHYSGADAFVFPSLYEGFGLPPLEAMACGCPVITSNLASMPAVCGDAAYYIDPYSIESIAKGIKKVLSDQRLRASLIKKGFERAKLFTWKRSAEQHIKVFEEVLNKTKQ